MPIPARVGLAGVSLNGLAKDIARATVLPCACPHGAARHSLVLVTGRALTLQVGTLLVDWDPCGPKPSCLAATTVTPGLCRCSALYIRAPATRLPPGRACARKLAIGSCPHAMPLARWTGLVLAYRGRPQYNTSTRTNHPIWDWLAFVRHMTRINGPQGELNPFTGRFGRRAHQAWPGVRYVPALSGAHPCHPPCWLAASRCYVALAPYRRRFR